MLDIVFGLASRREKIDLEIGVAPHRRGQPPSKPVVAAVPSERVLGMWRAGESVVQSEPVADLRLKVARVVFVGREI